MKQLVLLGVQLHLGINFWKPIGEKKSAPETRKVTFLSGRIPHCLLVFTNCDVVVKRCHQFPRHHIEAVAHALTDVDLSYHSIHPTYIFFMWPLVELGHSLEQVLVSLDHVFRGHEHVFKGSLDGPQLSFQLPTPTGTGGWTIIYRLCLCLKFRRDA